MADETEWHLVITGCGTSAGNPPWGRPDLWSDDPADRRRRSGGIIRGPHGEVLLIDCGPDLMHQLRDPYRDWDGLHYPKRCITRADGVLQTHAHADHSHGLNDLRHLNRLMQRQVIPLYGHQGHLDEIEAMFPYCFGQADVAYKGYTPALETVAIVDGVPFPTSAGIEAVACGLSHGPAGRTTGYRVGNLAYCTDTKAIPSDALAVLKGVDILVVGMLREELHPTHFNWAEAQDAIRAIQPQKTVLIHMGFEVTYADWIPILANADVPGTVVMATDGMVVPFRPKVVQK